MTAASKDRDTKEVEGKRRGFPVAANAVIYAGTIAVLNAGYLAKGTTAASLIAVGVMDKKIDNTGGSNGAITGEPKLGVFGPFANSASGDQIALADVGADCYIVDDSTVAKTSNSSARSVAGKVFNVDADGVWVKFS